jgi:coenzyme F420-reducing hydrogenase beta subunit
MKTEYLVAEFGTSIVFTVTDIEADLGIQWEAVKDYWVKWGTLHLEMNDGVVHTVDGSDAETEFKRPREVLEYDAEWNGG